MVDWFAAHQAWYWIVAWTSFALTAVAACSSLCAGFCSDAHEQRWSRRLPPWVFLTLALLCLCAFRWPIWHIPHEFNLDESEFLGEALTLQHRPVYWVGVDGTTHGPLDSYPLLLLRLVGLRYDYLGERVLSAMLLFVVFVACYRTMAIVSRDALARVAVIPILCALAFASSADFLVYASEVVPVTLLAVGTWLVISDQAQSIGRGAGSGRWLAGGLLLGSVPMAKLQGGPVALALLTVIATWELADGGGSLGMRGRRVLTLATAAVAPTVLFVLLATLYGGWRDFWIAYIGQNLLYAHQGHTSLRRMIVGFPSFAARVPGLRPYLIGAAAVAAACVFRVRKSTTAQSRALTYALVSGVAGILVALAPGRPYTNYLWFVVVPAGMIAGVLWVACWRSHEGVEWPVYLRPILLVGFIAVAIVPQVAVCAGQSRTYLREALAPDDSVAAEVMRYGRPGEPLGLWGYRCRCNVETGMWRATRDGDTTWEIVPSPQRDFFRQRYLRDLEGTRPPVFVDAVGQGNVFANRADAHESFPALGDYVAAHYRFVSEVDGCRIYVRADRLPLR
ncbi:MAG TPA: hypothetical protein VHE61_12490 [Opitutaceae bacterium]|nr:hypothetical protein [Opitutaceae bacterium]